MIRVVITDMGEEIIFSEPLSEEELKLVKLIKDVLGGMEVRREEIQEVSPLPTGTIIRWRRRNIIHNNAFFLLNCNDPARFYRYSSKEKK